MANCPYCEEPVSEDLIIFGGDVLHRQCYQEAFSILEQVERICFNPYAQVDTDAVEVTVEF